MEPLLLIQQQERGHYKVKLLHSLVQQAIHARVESKHCAQLVQCVQKGLQQPPRQALLKDQQLIKT